MVSRTYFLGSPWFFRTPGLPKGTAGRIGFPVPTGGLGASLQRTSEGSKGHTLGWCCFGQHYTGSEIRAGHLRTNQVLQTDKKKIIFVN